jgi:hypothetical protein
MTRFARIWLQLIPELLFEFQCEVNGIRASWLIAGDFFVVSGHSRLCPGCGGMWERESCWAVAEGVRCREKLSEQCTDCVPILGLDSLLCKTFLLDGQHQGVESSPGSCWQSRLPRTPPSAPMQLPETAPQPGRSCSCKIWNGHLAVRGSPLNADINMTRVSNLTVRKAASRNGTSVEPTKSNQKPACTEHNLLVRNTPCVEHTNIGGPLGYTMMMDTRDR